MEEVTTPNVVNQVLSVLPKKDGATIHTANATRDFLGGLFGDRVISERRRGGMDWPPT